jgi:uncharacterized membrane protein HdeD (DUF308 family)
MFSPVIEQRSHQAPAAVPASKSSALRNYYLLRAAVAAAWIAAALALAPTAPLVAAVLVIAYPAWDALANFIDARRSGGLAANRTQALNTVVSALTATAIAASVGDTRLIVAIFGGWAALSGLLQLATGVRRWTRYGAQWAMILSGAQSALAGIHFIVRSRGDTVPGVADLAPYAAFGAFYFLVSALLLTLRRGKAA